jgi:FkbM family methyltransferase
MFTETQRLRFYSLLLRLRPAQLAAVLKRCLGVRPQYIQARTGHTFWADPVSIFGQHLLREGLHEPQMTRLLELVLQPGDTFVDVGGNEGYFSILASSLVAHGTVHCIEPQTRLQSILRENFRVNAAPSILLHQLALSSSDGEVELFLRPSTNTGASSMYRHWKIGFIKEHVRTTTLDAFFQSNALERVRLLKVDCEGAEYLVIAGGRKVLEQQAIDFIAMEYHPTICGVAQCARSHEALQCSGYILTKVRGQHIYHLSGLDKTLQPLGDLQVGCHWDA